MYDPFRVIFLKGQTESNTDSKYIAAYRRQQQRNSVAFSNWNLRLESRPCWNWNGGNSRSSNKSVNVTDIHHARRADAGNVKTNTTPRFVTSYPRNDYRNRFGRLYAKEIREDRQVMEVYCKLLQQDQEQQHGEQQRHQQQPKQPVDSYWFGNSFTAPFIVHEIRRSERSMIKRMFWIVKNMSVLKPHEVPPTRHAVLVRFN